MLRVLLPSTLAFPLIPPVSFGRSANLQRRGPCPRRRCNFHGTTTSVTITEATSLILFYYGAIIYLIATGLKRFFRFLSASSRTVSLRMRVEPGQRSQGEDIPRLERASKEYMSACVSDRKVLGVGVKVLVKALSCANESGGF